MASAIISEAESEAEACSTRPALALAEIVREGLSRTPKQLPPWLFYDEAGSLLFEQITSLPEYYLTRIERTLLTAHASEILATAAEDHPLRLVELGAGSADKTRTLLAAALAMQGTVQYQPVDVSETALDAACERIAAELPGVQTTPIVADYTTRWEISAGRNPHERQLLLWIGSSIGNFEPADAIALLGRINASMRPGDGLLLGVDLAPSPACKSEAELTAAYDDAAGVTAAFNRNLLVRLNRDLAAEFAPEDFAHRAIWNAQASRMEMHLESLRQQSIWIEALETEVQFAVGERLHTENSYKYTIEAATELMAQAGFPVVKHWSDQQEWFAVLVGCKHSG